MKIFILNSSGNAGKSLIARELFYPRLDNAKIIEIETVNSGGAGFSSLNISKFKGGDDFTDIYMSILDTDNIILDVGASNLTTFWQNMSKFAGMEEMFDFFVIPTSTRGKIQEDTYKTINFLLGEGIPVEKIKVIFNEVKTTVSQDYEVLLSVDFPFDEELYILQNESLFNDLGFLKKTIFDIYNPDLSFYKNSLLTEKDGAEKLRLVKMDLANRMAQVVKARMDEVFVKITSLTPLWIGNKTAKKVIKAKAKVEVKKEEVEISENDEDL
ncbi:MAG: hypothetical protein Q9M36_02760 [Sulfurovum sp.]|nr:hypothetical protein [Sulfurovum sp.]